MPRSLCSMYRPDIPAPTTTASTSGTPLTAVFDGWWCVWVMCSCSSRGSRGGCSADPGEVVSGGLGGELAVDDLGGEDLFQRSEEHTSELQSRQYPVCRFL